MFTKQPATKRSAFASAAGYSLERKWKKLYDRIPQHHNSADHKQCYIDWRDFEKRIITETSVDALLLENINNEAKNWRQILQRIIDVILFLGERGLPLRGHNHLVGNPSNGYFLGILELISHYDPVLEQHLAKVKESQEQHQRLQVHYLSPEIQNEFIDYCADHVRRAILEERTSCKYYALIVDATPDSAHVEQTTFILRYVLYDNVKEKYSIQERFLAFADCNQKTGEAITDLIQNTLQKYNIPLAECRGQGYDNGSNMKGAYKGVQSRLLRENPMAIYSPCACHNLNLCGVDAAQCCIEAVTFFGVVHKCYNIFSASPQRWEVLQKSISCSLHRPSDTRWSSRVESVKPFAAHLPGLNEAIENIRCLNLTPETHADLMGVQKYIHSFECILMSSIWYKILSAINHRSTVLQARDSTIDVEIENISSLLNELKHLRNNWIPILNECKLVTENLAWTSPTFPERRHKLRKRFADESHETPNNPSSDTPCDAEETFKRNVFYFILDSIIGSITDRHSALKEIDSIFNFLWKYPEMSEENIEQKTSKIRTMYSNDVSEDLFNEVIHLKNIHDANLQNRYKPLELLNRLHELKIFSLFPNICIVLRIFLTLTVTVAEAERSFSILGRIKNVLRSTMTQNRLTSLGTLAIENQLARELNFSVVIDTFASKKARKVLF